MFLTSKSGFSLLEVVVSLLVLTIGVLALARSMAAMNRMLAAGTVLTKVAVLGTSQLETLVAGGCDSANYGVSSVDGITVRWSATSDSGHARFDVVLQYPLDYENRADSIAYLLSCPDEA